MISLITDESLAYPSPEDSYSPDESFPEYPFSHVSKQKNPVYRAVRECLSQAGFDAPRFGTPAWNPLGEFIKPGNRVFVLCNFVLHRYPGETADNFAAKCTHGAVLRPLLDYLIIATGRTGSVRFGNAPMQNCRWTSVLSETGADKIVSFYRDMGVSVEANDLRLFVSDKNRFGGVKSVERRPESGGVAVDLKADSLMFDLDADPSVRYRIMNYSPKRLDDLHSQGRHVYVISRRILEADVVLSLSKLKTHEKVGLTCALKSCVGTVGHKDSLPHHRFGSPKIGGDEYPPEKSGILQYVSALHERVQKISPDSLHGNLMRIMDRVVRKVAEKLGPGINEGGWWGNDTAWRMVLDLARIVNYATQDGRLSPVPVRRFLSFVDGIVAGEGEGPLFPNAFRRGLLLFSDNPVLSDYASSLLMGFDPDRIPMVKEAFRLKKFSLYDRELGKEIVIHNRKKCSVSDLASIPKQPFKTPIGWRKKLYPEHVPSLLEKNRAE
ncbi:MAG: DUF362 domain-containing protein [Candidatus Aminicenantes bacterium]|nr:DUF362 domain-containing protein [Candidatus Aminicenantes bacterium]